VAAKLERLIAELSETARAVVTLYYYENYLRVVDESADDYLYPESYFVLLDLPSKAQEALLTRA
jgi:hypothetical protein